MKATAGGRRRGRRTPTTVAGARCVPCQSGGFEALADGLHPARQLLFVDDAPGDERVGERDELTFGGGQVRVHGLREDVLVATALQQRQRLSVDVEGVAYPVEAGLPGWHRVGDAELVGDVWPVLATGCDPVERRDREVAHVLVAFGHVLLRIKCSATGRMAGRSTRIVLVVTPGLGSATPIRQSRVTISVSWSSVHPSVPAGRTGRTMKRCFWLESSTRIATSSGSWRPNSPSTCRGQRTIRRR